MRGNRSGDKSLTHGALDGVLAKSFSISAWVKPLNHGPLLQDAHDVDDCQQC